MTPETARVQFAAAELLGRDDLADRRLHEGRAAEEDRALAAHDHALVAHRGHVGAAGGARAEHGRELRDAHRRELRLVEEDAAEVLAIGEHLVLQRQERAARVDEVDARQSLLLRDLLCAQVLLDGHRVVGAALDGGVVADDHDRPAVHEADARDDAGAGRIAAVEPVGGERRDLEERAALVEQARDAVARQQLAARDVAVAGCLGPAERRGGEPARAARRRVRRGRRRFACAAVARGIEVRVEDGHLPRLSASTARPTCGRRVISVSVH